MKTERMLLVVLVLGMLSSTALATTTSFQYGTNGYFGAEDSSISKASGKTEYNYGAGSVNYVQADHTNPFKVTMVKFKDIFGAGAGQVPAGQTIASATLSMFMYNDLIPSGMNKGVNVYPILGNINFGNTDGPAAVGEVSFHQRAQAQTDWAGGTNNGPVAGLDYDTTGLAQSALFTNNAPLPSIWLDIDITNIVADWYDGSIANEGVFLMGTTGQEAIGFINDALYASPNWIGKVPILEVEYVPEPMTMSLLALGGVALIRRRRA